MKYSVIGKGHIGSLISNLKGKYKVVGPQKKENQFVLDEIEDVQNLTLLHKPTYLSTKKYFLPQEETLLKFSLSGIKGADTKNNAEPIALFGVHTCDIAGMICLEHASSQEPADEGFIARKNKMFIAGIECTNPCDEYATCISMGTHNPKSGYDIMLTDVGDEYLIHANSAEGVDLLSNCIFVKEAKFEMLEKADLIRLNKEKTWPRKLTPAQDTIGNILHQTTKSKVWDSVHDRCVSCGNCTNVCPTCYCFDIKEEVDLTLTSGRRYRTWDSCQLREFAEITGGENFRKQRMQRQKHRFLRKFYYSQIKFNRKFCVGCGRCTRTCMAKISLFETINSLAEELK
jgi:sulfhydrogenase subunit beta (sulfur reductase)